MELDHIKDERAIRREKKKRPRMRQHSRTLKKQSLRSVEKIHKVMKAKTYK